MKLSKCLLMAYAAQFKVQILLNNFHSYLIIILQRFWWCTKKISVLYYPQNLLKHLTTNIYFCYKLTICAVIPTILALTQSYNYNTKRKLTLSFFCQPHSAPLNKYKIACCMCENY